MNEERTHNRKYVIVVGDGMADYPLPELGGKTPLEVAKTPNMDRIAASCIGLVRTIPNGMEPGSDVANLSLLGYDPRVYHTGRAAFEAGSMRVDLIPTETAFRMNLVTLDYRSESDIIMKSHSAGDITTGEATQIVESLKRDMEIPPGVRIYPGVAYRHLFVWDHAPEDLRTIPPHDVLDQNMASYLNDSGDNPIVAIIRESWGCLHDHPVNLKRRDAGLNEANSIWLWGQGKAPSLPPFYDKFGLKGGIISAVDLLKGIGAYAGLESIFVEGATGYLDTNYTGKAQGAVNALNHLDFLFIHVEAPDEAAHNGNIDEKIQAIEAVDEKVIGTLLEEMNRFADYRIMVVSGHFTPVSKRTHTGEPAPFAWASRDDLGKGVEGIGFFEVNANESGLVFERGHELINDFLGFSLID